MRLKGRLRRIERARNPVLRREYQEALLQGYIVAEELVTGRPPTAEEIEAEKRRLSQPIRKVSDAEISRIAQEIERVIFEEDSK